MAKLSENQANKLAEEVKNFLDSYATLNAWEDSEMTYSSNDAEMLLVAANMLTEGKTPPRVWSSWGCGGFRADDKVVAKAKLDMIVQKINAIAV